MRQAFLSWAMACALLCIVVRDGARAQSGSDDPEAHRTALYREGTELAERGDWAEAAARFREVIAIRSAPKARIALAVAEENLGHLLEAERSYVSALAEARSTKSEDDEATALVALRVLSTRIPRIKLVLPQGVVDARVRVDGTSRTPEAGELALDPGRHTIVVEALRRQSFQRTLDVEERDRLRLNVLLPALTAKREGAESKRSGTGLPWGGLIATGAGAIATTAGFVLWGVGKGKENDVKAVCPNNQCPTSRRDELEPEIASAHDTIVAGNVVVAVGMAAVAVGTIWMLAALSSGSSPSSGSANRPGAGRFAPNARPGFVF